MKEIFITFISVSLFLYLLQTIIIYAGTFRLNYSKCEGLPKISILVALRNEAQTLKACLDSLLNLDYPEDKMEILLINDRSHDNTANIIEEYKKKSTVVQTLHIQTGIKGLSGKANAIAQGMEVCSGELILVTDGDCEVPPSWAKSHAAYYQQDVGLVGGFTLLDKKHDRTPIFGKIQSLDWAYLLSIGAGAMGFGIPLSVLGNNFSFRRQAYTEVGGYRNMSFTIIEDFALMKTLLKKTRWKVIYPIDPEMLVYSHPMSNLPRFYHQRKRWSAGGKEVWLYGKFLMTIALFIHVLLPLSFFVFKPIYIFVYLMPKMFIDFWLLWRTTGMVNRRDLLNYFILWEIFYFIYTVFFAPVLLFPTKVKWKETTYTWRFNWKIKKMTEEN